MEIKRTVKYESELDKSFINLVAQTSGCDKIYECIQCGTCSSTCPLSLYMDYTPRRLMAMIRAGFKNEVLKSFTIWICSSCYSCTVMCPAQIKITDVMYSLKRIAIQEGMYSKKFPIPVLAQEIAKIVESKGRNSELWVGLKMFLKTNTLKAFSLLPFGLKLLLKGRLNLRKESIHNRTELTNIFRIIKEEIKT